MSVWLQRDTIRASTSYVEPSKKVKCGLTAPGDQKSWNGIVNLATYPWQRSGPNLWLTMAGVEMLITQNGPSHRSFLILTCSHKTITMKFCKTQCWIYRNNGNQNPRINDGNTFELLIKITITNRALFFVAGECAAAAKTSDVWVSGRGSRWVILQHPSSPSMHKGPKSGRRSQKWVPGCGRYWSIWKMAILIDLENGMVTIQVKEVHLQCM